MENFIIITVENKILVDYLLLNWKARENKKQNKLGNRHQQTCVLMAYDQARHYTLNCKSVETNNSNRKSVDQPARSSRESNCELVGSVWPARA